MTVNKMDLCTATMICEGVEEARDEAHAIEAWQMLIDTGVAWKLQGYFGRRADALIDAGLCHAATGEGGCVMLDTLRAYALTASQYNNLLPVMRRNLHSRHFVDAIEYSFIGCPEDYANALRRCDHLD